MSKAWRMSAIDCYAGQEAYMMYATGLAVLNDPEETDGLHLRDLASASDREEVLTYAQSLIWAGLGEIIRFANPPNCRSPLQKAEPHFEQAQPHMRKILEKTCSSQSGRLEQLHAMIAVLRPLPVATNEQTYRAIAHGRRHLVKVRHVMGGFALGKPFGSEVYDRNFSVVRNKPKAQRADLGLVTRVRQK